MTDNRQTLSQSVRQTNRMTDNRQTLSQSVSQTDKQNDRQSVRNLEHERFKANEES